MWRRAVRKMKLMGVAASRRKKVRIPRISTRLLIRIIPALVLFALIPPIFFHLRLRRFHQLRLQKCGWLENPPLVCAHGGDSSKAAPNTMDAYRIALNSHVDCIEIDVSRSSDGFLFALHDRDLQRMARNDTAKVGYMSMKEIEELDAGFQLPHEFQNQKVLKIEDALALVSSSVRQVILDAKVGPPLYEKHLAKDILSVVEKTRCKNCLIWAKSDILGRDVIKLTQDVPVGYIVMKDPSTGASSNLLRMKGAKVAGVYHHLVDEKLVRILHKGERKVYAWTVDEVESMQMMLYRRIDGIVTGRPAVLQSLMQDIRTECIDDGFPLLP